MLPPTVRKSGGRYEIVHNAEPADLPEGLLEYIEMRAAEADSGSPKPRVSMRPHAGDNGLGDNTTHAAPPPPAVETMRDMLKHLVAMDFFERRDGVQTEADGRIVKVGWRECGMALKVAYGDEDGFDLWGETHEDERARADAPAQWASFAAIAQPGHVTIGTIIKAAKNAGFALSMMKAASTAPASLPASRGRAMSHTVRSRWTPTMGSQSTSRLDAASGSVLEPVWIARPFEILGQCRDPNGRAWGKQIRFRDADGRVHMRHVSDAALHGEPAGLCAELAGDGLRIDRARQRELAEYLTGVSCQRARHECRQDGVA